MPRAMPKLEVKDAALAIFLSPANLWVVIRAVRGKKHMDARLNEVMVVGLIANGEIGKAAGDRVFAVGDRCIDRLAALVVRRRAIPLAALLQRCVKVLAADNLAVFGPVLQGAKIVVQRYQPDAAAEQLDKRLLLLGRGVFLHVVANDNVELLFQARLEPRGRLRKGRLGVLDAGQSIEQGEERLLLETVPAVGQQDADFRVCRRLRTACRLPQKSNETEGQDNVSHEKIPQTGGLRGFHDYILDRAVPPLGISG